MGYYSVFEVADSDIDNLVDVLNQYSAPYTWECWNGNVSLGSVKWYDWLTDLQQLAYAYPKNFLTIVRYGEESPDMSRAVVKDGQVIEQRPNITWPE